MSSTTDAASSDLSKMSVRPEPRVTGLSLPTVKRPTALNSVPPLAHGCFFPGLPGL